MASGSICSKASPSSNPAAVACIHGSQIRKRAAGIHTTNRADNDAHATTPEAKTAPVALDS
jgi:hypothetical protein